MSQWQQVQLLDRASLEKVHSLYSEDVLPMEVRQYLSYWIEEQDWSQAARSDSSQSYCLFHTMLSLLDDQLGRLGLGEENNSNIVLKHNLRQSKRSLLAKYDSNPSELANIIDGLLREEQSILTAAMAKSQVHVEPPPDASVATSTQHNIEDRLAEMRRVIQVLKCSIDQLEDLQDPFHFRFRTYKMLVATKSTDPSLPRRQEELNTMIKGLDCRRKDILAQIQELLGRSDTLRDLLLAELATWENCQRLACVGAPCNTSLGQLEKWFTGSAEELFHLLRLLQTLRELYLRMTYGQDPLKIQLPLLENRLQEQIVCLLKSAFVVEIQPTMPHPYTNRPLVLKTSSKFSVRPRGWRDIYQDCARSGVLKDEQRRTCSHHLRVGNKWLLVKLLDRNHPLEVKIEIDRDSTNLTGFRRFNVLTSNTKTMAADRPQVEGLVCDFRHITLKEQKSCGSGKGKGGKGTSEGTLSVTEELHIITFTVDYCYQGLQCQLQTSTLPMVIISNMNQFSSAWASILWFIMLSKDLKNQLFFSNPPAATWAQLSSVLSCQFTAATQRGLNPDQLKMLEEKLCGLNVTSQSTITWAMFSKDSASGFSFWTWIDGILGLIQDHLLNLWKNDLIMGFVSRKHEKHLLKRKKAGTFLLRFSESTQNGGITCTWVEYKNDGSPTFRSVQPYTKDDLKILALPEIIRGYQLLADEDIPENPLQYLYPDTPRDEAFGPYYNECSEGALMEHKKYLRRRMIRVSARQSKEAQALEVNGVLPAEGVPLPDGALFGEEVQLLRGALPAEVILFPHDVLKIEGVLLLNGGLHIGDMPLPNGGLHVEDVPLPNGGLHVEDVPLPNGELHVEDVSLPNGGLHVGDVPLPNGGLHVEDVPLPNDMFAADLIEELGQEMRGLLFDRHDPFLPPPGEEQQLAHSHMYGSPDEFPELHVDEEDFRN